MTDFYTPPGWLSIWGFLDQIALKQFNQKIDCANKEKMNALIKKAGSSPGKSTPSGESENAVPFYPRFHDPFAPLSAYDILHLTDTDLERLTHFQKTETFPLQLGLQSLHIQISPDHSKAERMIEDKVSEAPFKDQNSLKRFLRGVICPVKVTYQTGSTVPLILHNFSDLLFWRAFFEPRKLVREALAQGTLQAYVSHEDSYQAVSSLIWHTNEHWYHLLAKGQIAAYIPKILFEDQVKGTIFFKKEDVDSWAFSMPCDQEEVPPACPTPSQPSLSEKPLINLWIYTTPWLMVLNEAYQHYGKEELGKLSKECVEDFMKAYITEKSLDVAASDIPFLAKFLRLPEQKKGRAYQSNQEKKS